MRKISVENIGAESASIKHPKGELQYSEIQLRRKDKNLRLMSHSTTVTIYNMGSPSDIS